MTVPSAEPVKLTVAHVLREGLLHKKRAEEEALQLKKLEGELYDSSEFDKWRTEMRSKDEAERARQIEARRIEMVIASGCVVASLA